MLLQVLGIPFVHHAPQTVKSNKNQKSIEHRFCISHILKHQSEGESHTNRKHYTKEKIV